MAFNNLSKLKDLKTTDTQDINILLLGNTGSDKATFINSFANYLHYESLENALNTPDLLVIIPSCMNIMNGDSKSVNIELYSDKKQTQTSEAYGIKTVKSYFFQIGKGKTLSLIDTPGMGHPEEGEQDDVSCEKILAYVARLKNLYAICFLMKVDDTARETAFLDYCEKRILSRLTKSVRGNIIFIFTNARPTNCIPGDTLSYLTTTINGIKTKLSPFDLPLKDNIFAIDNTPFRFLVARNSGINLYEWDQNIIDEIWKASTKECLRLISYIVGDDSHSGVPPYILSDSNSINHAQSLISQLSQPLMDIVKLILYNKRILVEHKHILKMYQSLSLETLKEALFIPSIELRVKELEHPAIVCTSVKCPRIIKVECGQTWFYSNKCVDPCLVTNVKELIGDPSLQRCISISGSRKCSICSCDYLVHMPVYYTTDHVRITLKDGVVNYNDNIHTKQQALKASLTINKKIELRKSKLDDELNFIIGCMVKFALFLQHNALLPFPDPYKNYIDHLILRKRMDSPNLEFTRDLEKLMNDYERRKKVLENRLTLCGKSAVQTYESSLLTPKAICKSISSLYHLEHTGKKIQELLKKQRKAMCWEYDETCECADSALQGLNQAKDVEKKKKVPTAFDEGKKKDRRLSDDKIKTSKANQPNTSEFRKRRLSELSDVSKQGSGQSSPYGDNTRATQSEMEQKCVSKDKRKTSKTKQLSSSDEFRKKGRFELPDDSKECRDQPPPHDRNGKTTQSELEEKSAPEPTCQESNQCPLRGPGLRYAPLPHHCNLSIPCYDPLHFLPLSQFPIHHDGRQQYPYQRPLQYLQQMPYQICQQGPCEGVLQFFQQAELYQRLLQYSQQSFYQESPQNCHQGAPHQRPS